MAATATALVGERRGILDEAAYRTEAAASGVSWAAVTAGAFVMASLYLILLALGAGLGLSSVSPWANVGASATAIGTASVLWLIAMEVISSAFGGYVAGRLRTKWTSVHSDEVYFRDTAHGLVVWSVGVVLTAAFLSSAAVAMVGGAAKAAETGTDPNAYYVDTMFRSTGSDATQKFDAPTNAEASRIFANALREKDISAADRTYLGHTVAIHTGISQTDAERRVTDSLATARQMIDAARKATSHMLLWMFISLLIGAFCASYAATIGGRQRDHVMPAI
jgi:hypothetical protein